MMDNALGLVLKDVGRRKGHILNNWLEITIIASMENINIYYLRCDPVNPCKPPNNPGGPRRGDTTCGNSHGVSSEQPELVIL